MGRKTQMNNLTSPELIAQVNPDNIDLLNDFVQYLKSVDRSQTTINAYVNDIQIAFVWNLKYNKNAFFCDWTKRQIVKYQNWLLVDNNNSPARVRRLKASLSSLSNFIETVLDDEYPDFRNIITKIESPVNQPVREKTVFKEADISGLLNKLMDSKSYDKACMLALALYSGRRKSELLRFKVSDFDDSKLVCGGSLYKTGKIKTKGRGSAGKQLECFCLAKQFRPYLDVWMDYRNANHIDSEWLFPDKMNPNEPMKVSTLNSWANSFTNIIGMPFYWHAMRHMTVTNFKRAGFPDSVIQQYIGWSDIGMVSVYSDISTDEQMGMYFTEEGIVIPEQKGLSDI